MINRLNINMMKNLDYKTMCSIVCIFSIALMIASCNNNSTKDDPYLVKYTDKLITQYPNYSSNKLAKEAILDSISTHAQSFIGKEVRDLEGLEFEFYKLIEGEKGYCVVFKGSCISRIDAPKGSTNKYVIATSCLVAFGNIDDEIATKLDKNKKYSISGILHNWDGDNSLGISSKVLSDDLDYGTYILDNMSISEIQ